jgi:23S rRNA (adenine2503-C2)-methyltransferase
MPAMKNISLLQLKKALNQYVEKTNRRVSFEYALMKDVNDSQDDLSSLISFCKDILCHVNLIPLNEIEESPFKPVSSSVMHYWESQLQKERIPSSIRKSRGSDISGACGQLAHVLSKATI